MLFYAIEPEVAGHLGSRSSLSTDKTSIDQMHYVFDGWLGDDILSTYIFFLATEEARIVIERYNGTGYSFDDALVEKSDNYYGKHDCLAINFFWWKIHGQAGVDDCGLNKRKELVVSEKLLGEFSKLKIGNCLIRKKPYIFRK
jgi:hypothetical protein